MPWAAAAAVASAAIGASASSKARKSANAANQAAIDANAYQGEIALDQYDHYKQTYRPVEDAMVADAAKAGSAAEYERAAGDAAATVTSQIDLARQRLSRTPGLDPSSAAAQAAQVNLELKGAALGASEQNRARTAVTDRAYAKRLDAVGMGKGLVAGASTGMASASAGAAALARNASAEASSTASGVGAAVSGIVDGIKKADWSKVTNLFGGSSTPAAVTG